MKNILITGGTGTLGSALAQSVVGAHINDHGAPDIDHNITIFTRNEADRVKMKAEHPYFHYITGDVRDYSEVLKACKGMDYVFHFAALKHVNICETQPQEAVKTNVLGTMNVINACKEQGVKLVSMSTDKAINPCNIYGYTKLLAESMVVQAGFVSIRSGNVMWSSGSVFPIWQQQIKKHNRIDITDFGMTRFFIDVKDLIKFIWECKDKIGTFTVPMKSFNLMDIAQAFADEFGDEETRINEVGLRPGERLHEFRDENTSSENNISEDLTYIFK